MANLSDEQIVDRRKGGLEEFYATGLAANTVDRRKGGLEETMTYGLMT